ncbi:predicted protein [Botrytis cinerea T4]|uniref:Uncharacterized protein n=1 Tax=Botryotinia fuckeliana (strain T4) TaxID=999810 RepID=G2XXR4_BOTF4|nr:predicted protein [Botrytis cinerea T4]
MIAPRLRPSGRARICNKIERIHTLIKSLEGAFVKISGRKEGG